MTHEQPSEREWIAPSWEGVGAAAYSERRRQGITQARLAEASGVTRQWLISFERGNEAADPRLALRVLRTLGLELVVRPLRLSDAERAADNALDSLFGDQ